MPELNGAQDMSSLCSSQEAFPVYTAFSTFQLQDPSENKCLLFNTQGCGHLGPKKVTSCLLLSWNTKTREWVLAEVRRQEAMETYANCA